jgi:hypothetical protein
MHSNTHLTLMHSLTHTHRHIHTYILTYIYIYAYTQDWVSEWVSLWLSESESVSEWNRTHTHTRITHVTYAVTQIDAHINTEEQAHVTNTGIYTRHTQIYISQLHRNLNTQPSVTLMEKYTQVTGNTNTLAFQIYVSITNTRHMSHTYVKKHISYSNLRTYTSTSYTCQIQISHTWMRVMRAQVTCTSHVAHIYTDVALIHVAFTHHTHSYTFIHILFCIWIFKIPFSFCN